MNPGTILHLLSSSTETRALVSERVTSLGRRMNFSPGIEEFKEQFQKGVKNFLIVDYELFETGAQDLLVQLLKTDFVPSGLVILSNLHGFESFLDKAAEEYTAREIPFLFLEIPFSSEELSEILTLLTQSMRMNVTRCLRAPKYNFRNAHRLGSILRDARENMGLDPETFLSVANLRGISVSLERLQEIETDDAGTIADASEWYTLIRLAYENTDVQDYGFEPWIHLRKVRHAILEKTYPFPVTFILQRRLVELSRREEIEERYASIKGFGLPSFS